MRLQRSRSRNRRRIDGTRSQLHRCIPKTLSARCSGIWFTESWRLELIANSIVCTCTQGTSLAKSICPRRFSLKHSMGSSGRPYVTSAQRWPIARLPLIISVKLSGRSASTASRAGMSIAWTVFGAELVISNVLTHQIRLASTNRSAVRDCQRLKVSTATSNLRGRVVAY